MSDLPNGSPGNSNLPPQNKTIVACFSNAKDQLRAAKCVLDYENLPSIAFYLAGLALEEIGKASLIGTREVARSRGSDTTFIDNRLDDHIFKLFWALWTPVFARGVLSRSQFDELHGLAQGIYEERLQGLYVSPDSGADALLPSETINADRARALITLAEACLGMEATADWSAIDITPGSDPHWFLAATEDQEKRGLIFGQPSLDKLKDTGNIREWIVWLRAEFDGAEARAKEILIKEWNRQGDGKAHRGREKWKVRIRLHSPAQSIRPNALKAWNATKSWIVFAPVQNKPHQLDIEFTFREDVLLPVLGQAGYQTARMFAVAMSIGSGGLWWWYPPDQSHQFYSSLAEVQGDKNMRFDIKMHPGSAFEWQRVALREAELKRVWICFGMMAVFSGEEVKAIFEPYATGLALLAKHDMHLNLAAHACERFARSLLEAMRHYKAWDGETTSIEQALGQVFTGVIKSDDDLKELADLVGRFHYMPPNMEGLTTERAAGLKLFCDVYFHKRFYEEAVNRAREEGGVEQPRS